MSFTLCPVTLTFLLYQPTDEVVFLDGIDKKKLQSRQSYQPVVNHRKVVPITIVPMIDSLKDVYLREHHRDDFARLQLCTAFEGVIYSTTSIANTDKANSTSLESIYNHDTYAEQVAICPVTTIPKIRCKIERGLDSAEKYINRIISTAASFQLRTVHDVKKFMEHFFWKNLLKKLTTFLR